MVAHHVMPLMLYRRQYKTDGDNMLNELLQLFFVTLIFIGVVALSYYSTQKIAKLNKRMRYHSNLEVIEGMPLIQGHSLYIIKAGKKYFLIGCSQKGSMTYVGQLEETELILEKEKEGIFQDQLRGFINERWGKQDENQKE